MKYKEQVQATTTINEILRFHTNPSDQNHSSSREIRSHMRRLKIRIYGRRTFRNVNGLIFGWMNDINRTI